MHRIGEDVSRRLDIVPPQYQVLVIRRPTPPRRGAGSLHPGGAADRGRRRAPEARARPAAGTAQGQRQALRRRDPGACAGPGARPHPDRSAMGIRPRRPALGRLPSRRAWRSSTRATGRPPRRRCIWRATAACCRWTAIGPKRPWPRTVRSISPSVGRTHTRYSSTGTDGSAWRPPGRPRRRRRSPRACGEDLHRPEGQGDSRHLAGASRCILMSFSGRSSWIGLEPWRLCPIPALQRGSRKTSFSDPGCGRGRAPAGVFGAAWAWAR